VKENDEESYSKATIFSENESQYEKPKQCNKSKWAIM